MNPDWVKDEITKYCNKENINEAEFYKELVEIYQRVYGWNLEYKKTEYCEEHSISFLGLVDFCEVKHWTDNFYTVFMGHTKEKKGEVYHEVYPS